MTWQEVGIINPSRNWQLTENVEGEFFRLTHQYSDLPTEYYQAELVQVEEDEQGAITTFGYQVIEASPTGEVIRLTKPECFSNRKIAIRQLSREVDLPPVGRVYSWAIGVERWVANANTGGGDTPTTRFSTNQATLRGADGLTLISSVIKDDENILLPDIGFDFSFFGVGYRTNIRVNSNSYFQFGTEISSISPPSQTLRGVFIGATDGNINKLYGLQLSPNAYLIRFEGNSNYTQQSVNKVWEATLFNDGTIQLTFGVWESNTSGYVSNGQPTPTTSVFAIAPNTSLVIDFPEGMLRIRSGSYTL